VIPSFQIQNSDGGKHAEFISRRGRWLHRLVRVHIVVDIHVIRLSQRLGLTKYKDPEKIEKDLMKLVPKE
jgi:hypothetical protein